MRTLSLNARFRSAALIFLSCWFPITLIAQSADSVLRKPDKTWAGKRIVTLKGFGDYFALDECQQPKLVNPEGLGVNIVAVAQRVENDRIWVKANGAGDAPRRLGWHGRRDPPRRCWTQQFRTTPLRSPFIRKEPFLYIRRGREFRILNLSRTRLSWTSNIPHI